MDPNGKWDMRLVICDEDPHALMMDPDDPTDFYLDNPSRMWLIFIRNLARRTMLKCCTMDYRTPN